MSNKLKYEGIGKNKAAIIEQICSRAGTIKEVIGISMYGSTGRGDSGYLSDVDLVILIESIEDQDYVSDRIISSLDHFTFLKNNSKYTVFCKPGNEKVDILFTDLNHNGEALKLIGGSKLSVENFPVIYSRQTKFEDMVKDAILVKSDIDAELMNIADSFLGYYDNTMDFS